MKTFKSFLIEQPVENSNGQPIHATDEGVQKFWDWFTGSKVVDSSGRPLIVYRGDFPNKGSFTGKEDPSNLIQSNVFFTDKPHIGKRYIRNPKNYASDWRLTPDDLNHTHGLYRVYLALKHPLVIDAKGESWDEMPVPPTMLDKFFRGVGQIDDIATAARGMGYDGLIVHDVFDQYGDGAQYVAFHPEQIKSATDNNGRFGATPKFNE